MQDVGAYEDAPARPPVRRQLHGRRVGRALSRATVRLLETRLPELRTDLSAPPPDSLNPLFPLPVDDVWLEVGFGGGEHLLWQARHNPRIGLIGCEPFITGVARVLRAIEEAGLANIRLHDDDARQLIDWLPEASIGRVFVLFPDPWPKKRHHKRRFLHASALDSLARVMKRGAHLRFATDIPSYAEMVVEGMTGRTDFASNPGLLSARPVDWPGTRYEAKAISAGRACQFFVFERV